MGSVVVMRRSAGAVKAPRSSLKDMQHEVLEAIAAGQRLDRVADLICRWIGRLAPQAICTVMVADGAGQLQPLAAPDLPPAFWDAARDIPIGPDASTCGRAAHLGVSVQTADIGIDPSWRRVRALPLELGLRACWSNPIHGQAGRVIGTFALYFRRRRGPTRLETHIVRESVRLCALAIDHEAVLARLEEANQRLDAALSNVRHGICLFDGALRLVMANQRYAEVYGLAPGQLRPGMSLQDIVGLRVAAGAAPMIAPDRYLEWRSTVQACKRPTDSIVELADGRFIAIHHRPMPDGGWVSTHEDVTERQQAEARITHLATHDPLTDLVNRNVFRDRIEQALAQRPKDRACAVIYIDLDRFKAVNDSFGHPVGDQLLVAVAGRLRACVRDKDTVTRLGGDEFAVLLPSIERRDRAGEFSARILQTLIAPYALGPHCLTIGASLGIATGPADGASADDLLKRADIALYRAKTEGGGWRLFEGAAGHHPPNRVTEP
jgi:diguanylate cyclase (GGDEF)-like protein